MEPTPETVMRWYQYSPNIAIKHYSNILLPILAENGSPEDIIHASRKGCKWTEKSIVLAVSTGKIDNLKHLIKMGICDGKVLKYARMNPNPECVFLFGSFSKCGDYLDVDISVNRKISRSNNLQGREVWGITPSA